MTFSSSGSINLTRRESSEATDIVTLLGLSGGPKKTQTQTNKQKEEIFLEISFVCQHQYY